MSIDRSLRAFGRTLLAFTTLSAAGCDAEPDGRELSDEYYGAAEDDDRIVDGFLNTGDPGLALVGVQLEGGQIGTCSGTLITPRAVLFAAHCVQTPGFIEPEDIELLLGYFGNDPQTQLTGGADPSLIDAEFATTLRVHPEWNGDARDGNDVAVMLFDRDIEGVEPVLLNSDPLESFMRPGDLVRIAGFGNSEVDFFTGESSGDLVKQEGFSTFIRAEKEHILTFGYGRQSQVCRGDSGGPTYAIVPGVGERQIAITSYEPDASLRCDSEALNVRVDRHLDWIEAASDPSTAAPGLEVKL